MTVLPSRKVQCEACGAVHILRAREGWCLTCDLTDWRLRGASVDDLAFSFGLPPFLVREVVDGIPRSM